MCIYVYYVYLYNLRSLKMSHSSEDNVPPKLLVGHSGAGDGDDDDVYYSYIFLLYNIIITNSVAYCLINNNSQWFLSWLLCLSLSLAAEISWTHAVSVVPCCPSASATLRHFLWSGSRHHHLWMIG